jgi:hypothetical protein
MKLVPDGMHLSRVGGSVVSFQHHRERFQVGQTPGFQTFMHHSLECNNMYLYLHTSLTSTTTQQFCVAGLLWATVAALGMDTTAVEQ